MNLFKTLLAPIRDGDDCTTQFIVGFVAVSLTLFVIFLLSMFLAFHTHKMEQAKIAVHNEETFKKLQAKHGEKATAAVVYEENGEAYYYLKGKKIKLQ
jgi:hypothetical protein